jgi:hypothetical protein
MGDKSVHGGKHVKMLKFRKLAKAELILVAAATEVVEVGNGVDDFLRVRAF